MLKRIIAAILWFYVMWAAWNEVAYITGWSILLGPVLAAAVSASIAGDPMHRIWVPGVVTERISRRLEAIRPQD